MSRKHSTGQTGKGRPTPPQPARGPKGRPTPTRSGSRKVVSGPVYRQRRFPPLPLAWKLLLATVWLVALVLAVLLVDTGTGRVGVMIAVSFALPILVVLVRDPSRRTRR